MTRISRSSSYSLQVRADRRQAALDRAAERAATGTNELTERQSLYSAADRPMTAFEKAKAEAERRALGRVDYTDAEAVALCSLYIVNGGDMTAARTDFFRSFPETKHSASSVWMKLSRIRTLDSRWEKDTEWETDQQVATILQGMDPERFAAS